MFVGYGVPEWRIKMCVALPGTVIEAGSSRSIVDFGGNRVEARSGLVDVNRVTGFWSTRAVYFKRFPKRKL